MVCICCGVVRKQPTPRKGTETALQGRQAAGCRNNPHPARGRKPCRRPRRKTSGCETTHTPQGDVNWCFSVNRRYSAKQPTPRKGTETLHRMCSACGAASKQPTPRKGTETFRDARMLCHCGNNPHPARGRKPKFVILLPSYYETTHTPQGDGNSDFHKLFEQEVETTHTPQGDGNRARP